MNSEPMPVLDRAWSAEVARRIRAQYRRCWRNAAAAVRHLGEEALYVEGWIIVRGSGPMVVEHGWCEVDGRIIDPTYTPHVSPLAEPLAYIGGVLMSAPEAVRAMRRGQLPIAWLQNHFGHDEAFRTALIHAKSLQQGEPRQATRVVNCRHEPCDVFIGRATKWGNPYRLGVDGNSQEIVHRFRRWIMRRPVLLRSLDELRGKRLGCICTPRPCHGDVLAELADLGAPIMSPGVRQGDGTDYDDAVDGLLVAPGL